MRATSRLLWIFFGCGLLLSGMAQARDGDKPPFHQLEFAGKTAFLMGSVHVGKADFYPLPNQIEQAYRHAGALVLEADVRDPAAQQLLQKYGLKAATPDEETQTLLQGYCGGKPLCRQLAMMSPWLQSVQISMQRFVELGYQPSLGVEQYLLDGVGDRPVLELESTEMQLALLDSLALEHQWSMVRESIRGEDREIQALITAWRSGNEKALAELMLHQLSTEGEDVLLEKLLWQRNQGMAERLLSLMGSNQASLFVAVGAGHLAGKKSLLEYLHKAGVSSRNCWRQSCDIPPGEAN
ncbi:TraB/GumN family protein [Shewanella algae]|uniref:TraB/GumN family protein n=1 Tax=Shewanella algae TaxID=38313 RepID=UPI001686F7B5|nr:TraB/GumN family protein [Shewanella algae]QNV04159.1 TraB/GumN family protein [Shewanella algae]